MLNIDKRAINDKGRIFRNPSHIEEREEGRDQAEIVDAIKKANRRIGYVKYEYTSTKKERVKKLPGVLKLRSMEKEELVAFFNTLFRSHPNIVSLHLKLGDYPSAKKYTGSKINPLNSSKRRFSKELAERFADLIEGNNIVEIRYEIKDLNHFMVITEAAQTSVEEYKDDKLFNPVLAIEFITK